MNHVFIRADGTTTEVDRFMAGPALRPGYEWRNESGPNDHVSKWVERPVQKSEVYDGRLFGYEEKELLAKQYKRRVRQAP